MIKKSKELRDNWPIHLFFVLFSLIFIIPLIYIISASFTNEEALLMEGYKLIPAQFELTAYKYVFANTTNLVDAYIVTAFSSITATILSLLIMSAAAYPLSRNDFVGKKIVTFIIFFTMLFGGGTIPTYILITKYLKLGNTIWVYIVTGLCSAFNIIVIKTFFKGIAEAVIESAKIDGASEFRIFFQIVLPLSKPVLATIGLMVLLGKWGDWYTSLLYIRDQRLYTLQYLLQKVLREAEFIKQMAQEMPLGVEVAVAAEGTPTETMKFALCILAAGPMLVVFPFFQKYFAKGFTVGSVKG